jgi:hypothetical protein
VDDRIAITKEKYPESTGLEPVNGDFSGISSLSGLDFSGIKMLAGMDFSGLAPLSGLSISIK